MILKSQVLLGHFLRFTSKYSRWARPMARLFREVGLGRTKRILKKNCLGYSTTLFWNPVWDSLGLGFFPSYFWKSPLQSSHKTWPSFFLTWKLLKGLREGGMVCRKHDNTMTSRSVKNLKNNASRSVKGNLKESLTFKPPTRLNICLAKAFTSSTSRW